ncbi:hypothetical protein QYF61_006669 [Mycteria americana]|uniref:Uncharacterized protein n=1 Tax=Mycteria americana TaxID=33587 RepID=A0AAN7PBW3_MYCAM|nr:hypothetical protein QYF61_006669 [Mycteria americana]
MDEGQVEEQAVKLAGSWRATMTVGCNVTSPRSAAVEQAVNRGEEALGSGCPDQRRKLMSHGVFGDVEIKRRIEKLEAGKRKRTSEIRDMENEGEISSRTPTPKTKLWDRQQNFSGLVVIYVPHTQEIPSPEGLSSGLSRQLGCSSAGGIHPFKVTLVLLGKLQPRHRLPRQTPCACPQEQDPSAAGCKTNTTQLRKAKGDTRKHLQLKKGSFPNTVLSKAVLSCLFFSGLAPEVFEVTESLNVFHKAPFSCDSTNRDFTLTTHKTMSGVHLYHLGPSGQERYSQTGEYPLKTTKVVRGLEYVAYEERVKQLLSSATWRKDLEPNPLHSCTGKGLEAMTYPVNTDLLGGLAPGLNPTTLIGTVCLTWDYIGAHALTLEVLLSYMPGDFKKPKVNVFPVWLTTSQKKPSPMEGTMVGSKLPPSLRCPQEPEQSPSKLAILKHKLQELAKPFFLLTDLAYPSSKYPSCTKDLTYTSFIKFFHIYDLGLLWGELLDLELASSYSPEEQFYNSMSGDDCVPRKEPATASVRRELTRPDT